MKNNLKLAHPPKTAEQLAQEWLDAKAEENAARAKRIEIEEELLAILPCREEGSQTIKLENEGWERDYAVSEPSEPRFTEPE